MRSESALKVVSSAAAGRRLVATQDVSAGDVLLEEEPLAATLLDSEVSRRCHHTFRRSERLLRCSRSRFGRYESRAAQAAAWGAGFREECAALVACAPRVPPATIRLGAQLIWRIAREPQRGPQLEALVHHWDKIPEQRKLEYAQMATLLADYASKGLDLSKMNCAVVEDTRGVALLLARLACNAMSICDEELRPIGIGLYLRAAMANHSCRPNAAQSFDGKRLALRALSTIRTGEEVTISYIELAATRQERRAMLLSQYYFDIDGEHAPPGPEAVLGEAVHPGVRVATFLPSQKTWCTDPIDVDLTRAGVKGSQIHGALSKSAGDDGIAPVDSFNVGVDKDDEAERALEKLGPVALYFIGADVNNGAVRGAINWLVESLRCERLVERLLQKGEAAKALDAVSSQLLDGNQANIGERHIVRIRLMQLALRAAVEAGNWEAALRYAVTLTPALEAIYPERWPALALHLATHAKLAAMDAHESAAVQSTLSLVERAVAMLHITHGSASNIHRELNALRGQLITELQQQQHEECGFTCG